MPSSVLARCYRPVDASWLAAFRILFGLLLSISMLRFLAYGWVDRFFVRPQMHFKYWGFEWVEPLSAPLMHQLFWLLAGLAICVSIGLFFRATSLLFALGLSYVQLIDVSTYLNHYYLAALLAFLLAASPAQRVWSVDAWRMHRRANVPATATQVPVLWLYLLRFQVAVVYCFAGLAKMNSDWLLHAQPLRIWLGAKTDLPLLGPILTVEGVPLLLSWCGFLFDTTIVFWLMQRRTRAFAYLAVIGFHTTTRLLFPIGMFPFIMTLAATVFFEPDWPRRLLGRIRHRRHSDADPRHPAPPAVAGAKQIPLPWGARPLVFAALIYAAFQVALPLRSHLYSGNVMWHEQGMRFSWRVMLRAKGGHIRFVVTGKNHEEKTFVNPAEFLTDLQLTEMVSQPDLILQAAHHIAREYESRGYQDPEVRADARIALNGRRSAVFVNPLVDLSQKQDGLAPLDWLAPAPTAAPHHTRPVL